MDAVLRCSVLVAALLAGCGADLQAAKVFKYDGSVQCGDDGVPVEEMRLELTRGGVYVACGQKGGDGRVYPGVCGAGTGLINVYTIDERDLPDAQELGFNSTDQLPDYQDVDCTQ